MQNTKQTKRPICLKFRVSEAEKTLIEEKMESAGIINREAYIRKLVLDGYILRLDFNDIRRLIFLLSNASNNLNQLAKKANETENIHAGEINKMQAELEPIWTELRAAINKLVKL